jgi:hypothetical protein
MLTQTPPERRRPTVVITQLSGAPRMAAGDEDVHYVRRDENGYLRWDAEHLYPLSAAEQSVCGRIGRIDQSAHDQLGVRGRWRIGTPHHDEQGRPIPHHDYAAIQRLLAMAVSALYRDQVRLRDDHVASAEATLRKYAAVRNRLRYLTGSIIGITVAIVLGALLFKLDWLAREIPHELGVEIVVFAGIGSLVSVLTRLSSLDLGEQLNPYLVYITGFSPPVVAVANAVVVYLILSSGIIQLKIGNGSTTPTAVYLVAAFLTGFSERFAQNIIGAASTTLGGAAPASKNAGSGDKPPSGEKDAASAGAASAEANQARSDGAAS